MHIVDGVLSVPVLAGGAAATLAGVAIGLKKMDYDQLPTIAMLAAAFFVASYIRLPMGFSSVHLILNGLMGLMLGWVCFPAMLVALLFQSIFFGFGGIVVLGVNTLNIALPGVVIHYLFLNSLRHSTGYTTRLLAGFAGALGIGLTTLMVALSLAMSGEAFVLGAKAIMITHIPIMVVEAIVTAMSVTLLLKVKPEVFGHLPTKASYEQAE